MLGEPVGGPSVRHEQLARETGIKQPPHLGKRRSTANIMRRDAMNVGEAPINSPNVRIDERRPGLDNDTFNNVSKPERTRTILRTGLKVDGKKGTGQSHANKS